MITIEPRPLVCWHARRPDGTWQRSPDNPYWRPITEHYPDTNLLLPGDIVLFQPIKPTLVHRAIQKYQGGQLFTHAAIYMAADHQICEADPRKMKVVFASLEDKLKQNCILFRRVRGLDEEGRHELALMAASVAGNPYGFSHIMDAVLRRVAGLQLSKPLNKTIRGPFVCSTLCEHAILAATKGRASLRSRIGHITTPADLATTDILDDINITWKSVSSGA